MWMTHGTGGGDSRARCNSHEGRAAPRQSNSVTATAMAETAIKACLSPCMPSREGSEDQKRLVRRLADTKHSVRTARVGRPIQPF